MALIRQLKRPWKISDIIIERFFSIAYLANQRAKRFTRPNLHETNHMVLHTH